MKLDEARAEFCLIFRSFFGRWIFKKKCFWDLLTFSWLSRVDSYRPTDTFFPSPKNCANWEPPVDVFLMRPEKQCMKWWKWINSLDTNFNCAAACEPPRLSARPSDRCNCLLTASLDGSRNFGTSTLHLLKALPFTTKYVVRVLKKLWKKVRNPTWSEQTFGVVTYLVLYDFSYLCTIVRILLICTYKQKDL